MQSIRFSTHLKSLLYGSTLIFVYAAGTIAAPPHKVARPTVSAQPSAALPVTPMGPISAAPFQWTRKLTVGTVINIEAGKNMTGTTYGGKSVSEAKHAYLRFKINDFKPAARQGESDMVQLLLWARHDGDSFRSEPSTRWTPTQIIGLGGLFSGAGGGAPSFGQTVPYMHIWKDGSYNPGDSFWVSEAVGLTGSKSYHLTYKGLQTVGKIKCGYFEYTQQTGSMTGGTENNDYQGQLWIDPNDGMYRLIKITSHFEFQKEGATGKASEVAYAVRS